MSTIEQAQKALVGRILEGAGEAAHPVRMASFHNSGLAAPLSALVDKVATHASRVVDEDIAAVKDSGLTEDQIFESVVCAAVGQAIRQYDVALAALETAAESRAGRSENAASNSR